MIGLLTKFKGIKQVCQSFDIVSKNALKLTKMHLQSEKFSRGPTSGIPGRRGQTPSRTLPLARPRLPDLPAENPHKQNPGYATE
jgi:hypothetical protein